MGITLYSLVNDQRKKDESKIAISFEGKNITYSEFMDRVDYIRGLIEEKEIKSKAIILATGRKPNLLAAMIAVVESGNYYVPIDYMYPKERIDYIITHCRATTVIVDEEHMDMYEGYETIVVSDEVAEGQSSVVGNSVNRELGAAYCLYTSGSTGNPKGVMIPEWALTNFVEGMRRVIPFESSNAIVCASTQCFDIFFLESITSLALGVTVYLTNSEEGTNPKKLTKLITDNNIDMIQMTPSRISMIKEYDKELESFKNIKTIMVGGEALPDAMLKDLQKNTTARIFNMYGPTETSIWSSVAELTDSSEIHIGMPILNTDFYIIDEDGNSTPDGTPGELCIGGAGLSLGYLYDEEKTAQRFITFNGERIYKTGDIGMFDKDLNVYKVFGRMDNQIKLNGFRIELEEIESICSNIEGVNKVVIYPYREDGAVKKLVMFYTAEADIDKKVITDYISKYLPPYMIPDHYEHVEKFEYTDNGKIDRKKLSYTPKVEKSIREVEGQDKWNLFRKIFLEVTGYAITENGGEALKDIVDSLHFVKFIVAIEDHYDIEIDDEYLDMGLYTSALDFYQKMGELINDTEDNLAS